MLLQKINQIILKYIDFLTIFLNLRLEFQRLIFKAYFLSLTRKNLGWLIIIVKQHQIYHTMRGLTYFLIYFLQTASNAIKTSFIFVQAQLISFYGTNTTMLGLILSLFALMMGAVFVYRAIYPYSKPVHTNFVNYTLILIILLALPLTMVLGINSIQVFGIIFILFGFLQGALQNILVALLTRKFSTSEDGFLMGLWAASPFIGNIVSLMLFTVMIYYMKIDWKWCLMISPVLTFIGAGLIKLYQEELPQQQGNQNFSNIQNVKAFFSQRDKVALFIANIGLQIALYGIMQWLPMYLNQQGFEDFQGYITISLVSFIIIGTMVCKQMYPSTLSRRTQLLIHVGLMLIGISSLLTIYLSHLTPKEKWIFIALVAAIGFSVGSLFNLYINHEIIILTERHGEDVSMNMNITYGFSYLFTGVSQTATGVLSSMNANSIFLVFLCLCAMTTVSIAYRVYLQWNRNEEEAESAFEDDSVF